MDRNIDYHAEIKTIRAKLTRTEAQQAYKFARCLDETIGQNKGELTAMRTKAKSFSRLQRRYIYCQMQAGMTLEDWLVTSPQQLEQWRSHGPEFLEEHLRMQGLLFENHHLTCEMMLDLGI